MGGGLYLSHIWDHRMSRITHQHHSSRLGTPSLNPLNLGILPLQTLGHLINNLRQDWIPSRILRLHIIQTRRFILFSDGNGAWMAHNEIVERSLTDGVGHDMTLVADPAGRSGGFDEACEFGVREHTLRWDEGSVGAVGVGGYLHVTVCDDCPADLRFDAYAISNPVKKASCEGRGGGRRGEPSAPMITSAVNVVPSTMVTLGTVSSTDFTGEPVMTVTPSSLALS
jgi:hypothetical protein